MTSPRSGPVIVIGAGGHAKVVVEALRAMGYAVTGLVAPAPKGTTLLGVPVLGDDGVLPRLRAEGIADAALGVGDNRARGALAERLLALGFNLPPVLHPAAWISPSSGLSPGVVVLQGAGVSAETRFGRAALINSGAIVEHDSEIEEAAHVAPGCALGGHVRVGARTLVGIGSAVRPGVVIGADVVVGAGSVVVGDVPAGATVMGCPARVRSADGVGSDASTCPVPGEA
jgi:UDP-perosamine 4-acetyltransferase